MVILFLLKEIVGLMSKSYQNQPLSNLLDFWKNKSKEKPLSKASWIWPKGKGIFMNKKVGMKFDWVSCYLKA